MLIHLKIFVEWPKTGTGWNFKNCGFSICTGSTIDWIGWDDSIVIVAGYVMKIIGIVDTIGSSWILVITWSRLGSSSSSMLSYVVVASSSSPPLPPISFEQVRSSSSFESLTSDPKVVVAFFFGGQVIGSKFNLSLGVGNSMHIFSRWN